MDVRDKFYRGYFVVKETSDLLLKYKVRVYAKGSLKETRVAWTRWGARMKGRRLVKRCAKERYYYSEEVFS